MTRRAPGGVQHQATSADGWQWQWQATRVGGGQQRQVQQCRANKTLSRFLLQCFSPPPQSILSKPSARAADPSFHAGSNLVTLLLKQKHCLFLLTITSTIHNHKSREVSGIPFPPHCVNKPQDEMTCTKLNGGAALALLLFTSTTSCFLGHRPPCP